MIKHSAICWHSWLRILSTVHDSLGSPKDLVRIRVYSLSKIAPVKYCRWQNLVSYLNNLCEHFPQSLIISQKFGSVKLNETNEKLEKVFSHLVTEYSACLKFNSHYYKNEVVSVFSLSLSHATQSISMKCCTTMTHLSRVA